jgi:peptidoglycan hydrolase-like protein with peptidoglycan-binding domain
MRQILGCAAIFVFVALAWSAQPVAPAKKTPGKTSAASKTTATRAPVASSKTGKKALASRRPAATWRNRQLAPTPERYRQIQEALAAKGYLRPEDATGSWNQTSVDALKRFQSEQKIESNGKINSLSLIALGLGPKHDAAVKPPVPPSAQEQIPGRE